MQRSVDSLDQRDFVEFFGPLQPAEQTDRTVLADLLDNSASLYQIMVAYANSIFWKS